MHVSDAYLIGFAAEFHGVDAAEQAPAQLEMQRRLKRDVGEQAAEMVRLTDRVWKLTIVLAILAAAQIVIGGSQLFMR